MATGPLFQVDSNSSALQRRILNFVRNIRLEDFTATELDKIFSGNKPCQLWTKVQRFGDRIHFHHQGKCIQILRRGTSLGCNCLFLSEKERKWKENVA
jgi:hypothetical protein